jgi:hypothetical protein
MPGASTSTARWTPLERCECPFTGHRSRQFMSEHAVSRHFGKPTPDQKRAFTRVLQGHVSGRCARHNAGLAADRTATTDRHRDHAIPKGHQGRQAGRSG